MPENASNADDDMDWGSFYDPKNIFCGEYDCYKILGFDYTTFHLKKPNNKEITKSYRKLSRRWHPDKNKEKGAKERFVKITRAYEVLTNKEKQEEYDYFRDRPDEYFYKYGSSVLWKYAPQSNTWLVVISLLGLASLFTVCAQYQKWKTVADRVIKAAVEDTREGGTSDVMEIRKEALEILAAKEAAQKENINGASINAPKSPRKKSSKLQNKEKKKQSQDELRKIVIKLVEDIDDFGAGFHKPTYKDAFVYKLILLPVVIVKHASWWIKYLSRRLRKLPYLDEELEFFTKQAIGDVAWEAATEEEQEQWITLDLWIMANYEKWREDQEVKKLSAGWQKKHARWKKKQGLKVA